MIGFKLRVMRLNRVESFYVFLLRFCSERSEEGRPTTVRPLVGVASLGQAPCRGGHPQLGRFHPKAQPLAVRRSQGLSPTASPTASRGGDAGCRGGRPFAGWMPTGKGNSRLRRSSGDG
ncbi:hypothetical protein GW17_00060722 [Ensete ventricosum]|nr:hypothetical protein GW17_00060722 [Ensete ventricosum]